MHFAEKQTFIFFVMSDQQWVFGILFENLFQLPRQAAVKKLSQHKRGLILVFLHVAVALWGVGGALTCVIAVLPSKLVIVVKKEKLD